MGTANHLTWVAAAPGVSGLVHLLRAYVLCRMAARYGVDIETRHFTSYLRITKTAVEPPHGAGCTGHGARCPVEESQDHGTTRDFAETRENGE
jgi:hypothetical protein